MGWKEIGLIVGLLVAWFALSRWVLPWFGIPTCSSGACGVPPGASLAEPDDEPGPQIAPERNKSSAVPQGIRPDAGPEGPTDAPGREQGVGPPGNVGARAPESHSP